jgi:DNA-binding NarL/FixJ family response regulator
VARAARSSRTRVGYPVAIASHLLVQEDTLRPHLKKIYSKLNVSDRTAAVNVALRRGIIHLT